MNQENRKKKIWIPPADVRGDYKHRRKYPYPVEINSNDVSNGFFVKFHITKWLNDNIGIDKYGYVVGEKTVIFRFKNEEDIEKFIIFIENL
ncbi:MAG: hypothetical protein WC284_12105 [Candidimonas sp.]